MANYSEAPPWPGLKRQVRPIIGPLLSLKAEQLITKVGSFFNRIETSGVRLGGIVRKVDRPNSGSTSTFIEFNGSSGNYPALIRTQWGISGNGHIQTSEFWSFDFKTDEERTLGIILSRARITVFDPSLEQGVKSAELASEDGYTYLLELHELLSATKQF